MTLKKNITGLPWEKSRLSLKGSEIFLFDILKMDHLINLTRRT